MNFYLYQLKPNGSIETAQEELEQKGLKDIFILEDDAAQKVFIGGHAKKEIQIESAILVEKKKAQVNWEEQWSEFAENFKDGKAHIDIKGQTLQLHPGAGFGDLSHPTTKLMIEMMKSHVKGESIIDIGTGSGILALGALLMGAKSAIGIDIDEEALKHARENAKLNHLKAHFSKKLPPNLSKDNVMLMNMIFPEQKDFQPQKLNKFAKLWIISGILDSGRKEYLEQTQKWDWKLVTETKQSEWVGFAFKTSQ